MRLSYFQIAARKHILQYAIKFRDFEFVKMLCDAGADVNMLVRVNNYFWVSDTADVMNCNFLLNMIFRKFCHELLFPNKIHT